MHQCCCVSCMEAVSSDAPKVDGQHRLAQGQALEKDSSRGFPLRLDMLPCRCSAKHDMFVAQQTGNQQKLHGVVMLIGGILPYSGCHSCQS